MKENWLIKEQNPELSAELARKAGVSQLVGQLLVNRGIKTAEDAAQFFENSIRDLPNPLLMSGMEDAVSRIVKAVYDGETVAVYGDYDADGVTSTSLLCGFFRSLEMNAIYFVPHRVKDGYGINERAVRELGERGATLIISTDCGITAVSEVEAAKELGIDFIITDHHLPEEKIPDAVAVVNPKLPGCKYPEDEKELAGVGVAFNLALAVRASLREKGFFDSCDEPNMAQYLDLVAIGTVTDRVLLAGANRIMVREGIRRMQPSKRPGIIALKEVSRINGGLNSDDIAFRIGPRINAAGRIGGPEIAVDLLLSESTEEARKTARQLDEMNRNRQQLERGALEEAILMLEQTPGSEQSACMVLASESWHPGIIGPLASRLVERYSKPAFAIAIGEDGTSKGSGRTIPGINLHEALKHCSGSLLRFGGHAMAAGITVEKSRIDSFRKQLDAYLKTNGMADDRAVRESACVIDAQVNLEDVTTGTAEQMESLEPFGSGNPKPVLLLEGVKIVSHNIIKNSHLKLFFDRGGNEKPLEAMWWNAADREKELVPEGKVDIVFTLGIENWGNRRRLALRMVDMNLQ